MRGDGIHNRPVIIGGGLAGLLTALHLSPRPVVVLSKAPLGVEASSAWAQGGIAAAVGPDDDAAQHLADTLAAGDGLCDPAMAEKIVSAGPKAIETLVNLGVAFDRDANGALALGREAAHGRNRIVHAGDRTGAAILRAVVEAVRKTPSITVLEGFEARHICVDDGCVTGLVATRGDEDHHIATGQIVIATGGVGGLYSHSTNPAGSFGQGPALAARAGARLRDLEFVQFHPTALDGEPPTLKLISEALRGDGAVLIDETGQRFMAAMPGAELAPRDIVARAIWAHLEAGHRVFLDARQSFATQAGQEHFGGILAICRAAGIDPAVTPIPVRPAVHYHMGGIDVSETGRSSVHGLWACGEAACTGLHGANRLASNSLLEAVVCAEWVAEDIALHPTEAAPAPIFPPLPPASSPESVRPILSNAAGVWRDGATLRRAFRDLGSMAKDGSDPAILGMMIALAALRREESRGAHARHDFPDRKANARSATLTLTETWQALAEDSAPSRHSIDEAP